MRREIDNYKDLKIKKLENRISELEAEVKVLRLKEEALIKQKELYKQATDIAEFAKKEYEKLISEALINERAIKSFHSMYGTDLHKKNKEFSNLIEKLKK